MQQREPNVKGFIKSLHPIFIFNTNTAILRSSEKFYFLTRWKLKKGLIVFFRNDTTTTVAILTTVRPLNTKGDEITNPIEAENSSESQRNEIR